MKDWLTLRLQEFTEGRRPENPLGPVSEEQKKIGARLLAPALEALNNGSADGVRLVDLEYTAIRSFAMKRLAIMHGKVDPLTDIALINERRDLMLRFLLEPKQRTNLVKVAYADATVECIENYKPVPLLPYTLFFSPEHIYQGATDEQGVLTHENLPLGPYILTINNPKFNIVASGNTDSAAPTDPTINNLASSILKDCSNKLPVVRAWLNHDADNEAEGIRRVEHHLLAIGANASTSVSSELRQQCLSALGLGSSQRETSRKSSKVFVSCPKPVVNKGCAFAIISLVLGLLKKPK